MEKKIIPTSKHTCTHTFCLGWKLKWQKCKTFRKILIFVWYCGGFFLNKTQTTGKRGTDFFLINFNALSYISQINKPLTNEQIKLVPLTN